MKAVGPSPLHMQVWYVSPVAGGRPVPGSEPGMSLHIVAGAMEQLDMAVSWSCDWSSSMCVGR